MSKSSLDEIHTFQDRSVRIRNFKLRNKDMREIRVRNIG